MTKNILHWSVAGLSGLAIAAGLLVAMSVDALAVPKAVKKACRSDYFAFCSMHAVGSPELRQCMRTNGKRLSHGCVDALVTAGLTPRPKGYKSTKVAQTAE